MKKDIVNKPIVLKSPSEKMKPFIKKLEEDIVPVNLSFSKQLKTKHGS